MKPSREGIIKAAKEAFIARGFWPNEVMWQCWLDAWLGGHRAGMERSAQICADLADKADALNEDIEPGSKASLYQTGKAVIAMKCAGAIRKEMDEIKP